MQAYLLSAVGVIFLSVIVSLLIPEGKLNKTITFVMRLICILVLIQPIMGIFKIKDSQSAANFFDYEYVSEQYSSHQSAQLAKLLKEEFEVDTECRVKIEYEEGEFRANGVEVALDEKDGHLIEKIYAYLEELKYINISVYAKSS